MKSLRIAILTTEFVTEWASGGGVGNFLQRLARAFKETGHEPEVFVISSEEKAFDFCGIRVERVRPLDRKLFSIAEWYLRKYIPGYQVGPHRQELGANLRMAWSLNRALERRHSEQPFDLVHSTTLAASGLFVRRKRNRSHICFVTSNFVAGLQEYGSPLNLSAKLLLWIQLTALHKANQVYAHSQLLSDYYVHEYRIPVRKVFPPMFIEAEPVERVSFELPDRYLIHFGLIGTLKGSDLVAQALSLAWQQEPGLRMIWAGTEVQPNTIDSYRALWAHHASNVNWLGSLEKPVLYAVLKRAIASVLPSRVDNLPNTVSESLLFGIPVIGSRGASIDELVEDGSSGALVPIGNVDALAAAMLRAWRGQASWLGTGFQPPRTLSELDPEVAVTNLLRLAGFENETNNFNGAWT